MAQISKIRLGASIFSPSLIALLVALIVSACQSGGTSPCKKVDLSLSFNVLGVAAASSASGSSVSKSISRLILSTASTLTVSMTPIDSGLSTPTPQTVAIASGQVVSVSFSDITYGNYAIKAVANDSSGAAQFQQSASLSVSGATTTATLNLVPVAVDMTAIGENENSQMVSITLDPGATYTYRIPAAIVSSSGSNPIAVGAYELNFTMVYNAFKVYAQDADGSMLYSADVSSGGNMTKTGGTSGGSGSVVYLSPSSSSSTYLTIYNDGTTLIYFYVYLNSDNKS